MKIAAMESMWHTEPAPANFNLLAIPNQKERRNDFAIEIPWAMGIIGTRSLTTPMLGINDLVEHAEVRIVNGIEAYNALQELRADKSNAQAQAVFDEHWKDLGYALLLKRYVDDLNTATPEQIAQAAWDTVPQVAPLFWAFRIMVGLGFYFIAFFMVAFYLATKDRLTLSPRFLKLAVFTIPLPWIAIECGWFVAEFGRQPWIIEGVLPTYYAASGLSVGDLIISLAIFIGLYSILALLGLKVMLHAVREGPDEDLSSTANSFAASAIAAK